MTNIKIVRDQDKENYHFYHEWKEGEFVYWFTLFVDYLDEILMTYEKEILENDGELHCTLEIEYRIGR